MTAATSESSLPSLVVDAMVLHHFAKSDRLDVLGASVPDMSTTHIVATEVDNYSSEYPSLRSVKDLEWLRILPQDTNEELIAFGEWIDLLGAGEHDLGEASVFAAAQIHGLVAITDDRDATRVGRKRGLVVHGTVWLLTRLQRLGKMTLVEIAGHVDALRDTGMRLPCTGRDLPRWAAERRLL